MKLWHYLLKFATDLLQLSSSLRNSPTFKSFEEKVETTVTSLKVMVKGCYMAMLEVWWLHCPCHLHRKVIEFAVESRIPCKFHATSEALLESEDKSEKSSFSALLLLLLSAKVNKWSQKCQKYAHTKVENRDISGVTTVHYAVWGRAMWRHKVQFCKQCSLTSFVLCHARQKQLFVYRLKLGPGWSYSPCSTRDVLTECPWLSWWELSCNSVLSYHLCSQHWSSLSLMQVSIFSLISIFCLYLKFQNHINIFAVGQKHLMRKLLGITNNTC